MDIKIYEDQTGQMLFPEKRSDKDRSIVRLFDNKIDLYINKIGDKVEINCYILARKSLERAIGCYIIYSDYYSEKYFTNFKNESYKTMQSLGFKPLDDAENVIFNNIEKFDSGTYSKDIDIIIKAINSGECLYYKGGNITEISAFCRELIKNTKNIKIAISTRENNLGEINILRDKISSELVPINKTIDTLNRQKNKITKKLADERKEKEGSIGKNKIHEGFRSIEEGVKILASVGYTGKDIFGMFNDFITKIFTGILTENIKFEIIGSDSKNKNGDIKKIIFLVGTATLLLGLLIGTFAGAHMKGEINSLKERAFSNPTPTPIPTLIPTPEPTKIFPVSDIANMTTPNATNLANISENNTNNTITNQNISQENRSNSTISQINNLPKVTPIQTPIPNTPITVTTVVVK